MRWPALSIRSDPRRPGSSTPPCRNPGDRRTRAQCREPSRLGFGIVVQQRDEFAARRSRCPDYWRRRIRDCPDCGSRGSANSRSAISAEPSVEPLSTTIASKPFCGLERRDSRLARSSSRRFQLTMMTETLNLLASAHVIIQLAPRQRRLYDFHRRKIAPSTATKSHEYREDCSRY